MVFLWLVYQCVSRGGSAHCDPTWWLKRPIQGGGGSRSQAHAAQLAGSEEQKSWIASEVPPEVNAKW